MFSDSKIKPIDQLVDTLSSHPDRSIVFTNGCFDLLHVGHVDYLEQSKMLGNILVVGINSDNSVKKLKGQSRPIIVAPYRAALVAALGCVDFVTIFEEDTPLRLIEKIRPNVVTKGAGWREDEIVGGDFVKSYGGMVVPVPVKHYIHTGSIIGRILLTLSH